MTTPAGWAEPDERALLRSPLINVVWQVRFTPDAALSDGRTALRYQDLLGMETTLAAVGPPQVSFQLVAGGMSQSVAPSSEQPGQGWRLSAADGTTHVTLSTTSLAVETTRYGTWNEHFRPWIAAAVAALAETADPGVALRVGMRYVNAIFGAALELDPFTSASELREVVVPSLLGLVGQDDFAADVEAFQGRHLLRIGQATSHVQHALVTADSGEVGLLLDIDTYAERTAAFDAAEVLEAADDLHVTGLAVFQHCVTQTAWQAMGPQERSDL